MKDRKEIDYAALQRAGQEVGIGEQTLSQLWTALAPQKNVQADLSGLNVAYYAGGLLIIAAATFFMTKTWATFGSSWAFALSLLYAAILAFVGKRLYDRPQTRRPGGICVTAAVAMTPLVLYAFEKWQSLWADGAPGSYHNFYELVHGSWTSLEIGTVIAGLIALRFVRFPFITLPIVAALFYFWQDIVGVLNGGHGYSAHVLQGSALVYGLLMIGCAVYLDKRTREDYGFWMYLYGGFGLNVAAMRLWENNNEITLMLFALFALGEIFVSIVLQRRALTAMGALGILAYLAHLSSNVFKDALSFSLVLSLLGVGLIYGAIQYQKYETEIRAGFRRALHLRP